MSTTFHIEADITMVKADVPEPPIDPPIEPPVASLASGINMAWMNFDKDFGAGFDVARFAQILTTLQAVGTNTIRFWIHTRGQLSPQFNSNGTVIGPGGSVIADLKTALDMAHERGIKIVLSMWAHTMMKGGPIERNRSVIADPDKTNAYINNALFPILEGLANHPAVHSIGACAEIEQLNDDDRVPGLTIPKVDLQRFVSQVASAVHQNSNIPFANDSWTMRTQTDVDGHENWWRDDRLIAVTGLADGIFDFYRFNWYGGSSLSPWSHPASYWQLDKPLGVSEFYADMDHAGVPAIDSHRHLFLTGYNGALAWSHSTGGERLAGALASIERARDLV